MSTRSMTLVEQPYAGKGEFIPLYRHCDGYPAEAGAAILEATANAGTCEDVIRTLLNNAERLGEYRLATWQPQDQGDLEHVYIVEAANGVIGGRPDAPKREWIITHYARPGFSETTSEDYRKWPKLVCARAQFARLVNQDRRTINARMKARGYEGEAYPMVECEPQAVQP